MYAEKNDDHLPHYGWAPEVREWKGRHNVWWPTQLFDLMNGETDMYVCPSDGFPYREYYVYRKPGGTLVGSIALEAGRFPLDITYRGSCTSSFQLGKEGRYHTARRISDWEDPGKALILIEANIGSREDVQRREQGKECFRFEDMLRLGSEQWYKECGYVESWERHTGTSNFLFLDGAVRRLTPPQVPDIIMQQEFWEQDMERRKAR